MAALPANSTHRLFFDYVTGNVPTSREHTAAVRYNQALRDVGDVQADFLGLLNVIGAAQFRTGWRILGVRVQATGSNFSNPITVIASLASFAGTGSTAYDASQEAVEDTFQGRSGATGRRVDFSLFRAMGLASPNFRVPAGTAAGFPTIVGNVANYLDARALAGSFVSIDGIGAIWKRYMNCNYNSYWESRSRTT